jgi:hypothetical protein
MLTANPPLSSTPESRKRWGEVWVTGDGAQPFNIIEHRRDERPSLLQRLLGFRL